MKWPNVPVDDIAVLVTKGTTPTSFGKEFASEGINFIKAESLNGDSSLDPQGFYFIDDDTHQQLLKRSILMEDDVLVTIAGAQIGKCGYVKVEHLPANTNQAVGIIRINKEKALPKFVYYFFKLPATFSFIQNLGAQSAQPNLNLGMLRQIKLSLPTYSEQHHIADVLSAYDDLIENNRRRMALHEDAARQLYHEWFVRLRFPGREHTKIVDGVPEGWERKTAFDAIHVLSGGTPKTSVPDYWDGEIPFYTPKDAADGIWATQTERSITEQGLKNCNSKLYQKGTVFISARGTVGKLNMAQCPMAMSQSCYALTAKNNLPQTFIFCAMEAAVEALKQQAVGAVFDAIVVDTFKRISILIPEPKLIREFDDIVADIFSQTENLTLQNEKLKAARDLLLPRLMSGEIPV